MAIYRGEGGAGDATADASNAAALADSFADAANASAGQAATSAAAALAAKTAAELAETNAETAETNAEAAEAAAVVAKNAAEAVLLDTGFTVVASDLQGTDTIGTVAADIVNVNAVANNIDAVIAVDANEANINIVAADGTDIGTVATSIADVNSVADNIADVTAVADNETNIDAVAANNTNITTVAGISGNVTTVAGISANVTTVATNDTNVTTVATNIANVNAVGTNIANVNSVAGNSTNINAVAGNSTNINTVAGISANVTTVATNNANVTTVAGSIANVNTNATNIANINQNAANIVAIQNASANATAAASSATAAAGSATSASASAAAASAVALGNEPVRHSIRPSLLLDFANTKTLDPRITFTRASTATFYDGKTVAKAEENLFERSQEFDNARWIKTASTVTANSTTAPDGTATAETVTPTATTSAHIIQQIVTVQSGLHTFSVYVKANGYNFVLLNTNDAITDRWQSFDLSAGTLGSQASGVTSSSITSVGNGWYRCVLTTSQNGTFNNSFRVFVNATDVTAGASYLADGTSGIHIWGAQLEQRSSATAYTATTTAPITNYIPALQSAASGVARFEHNPVTGESLGLEIEEQRTNLALYSAQFDDATWIKSNSTVTTNTIIAPDGTLTGEKLIDDTSATEHALIQPINYVSGTSYTFSAFAKKGERNFLILSLGSFAFGTTTRAYFNLDTGAVGTLVNSPTATITAVGNGWYRCTITKTATATSSANTLITVTSADNTTSYTGNGFDGLFIWGAQLEAGAFATSYIPTVASQVTRSPDSALMTGTNFSSWFRADEGALYSEFASAGYSSFNTVFDIGTNATNTIQISLNSSSQLRLVVESGTAQANLATPSTGITFNTATKYAGSYKVNDFAGVKDGGAVATDTLGVLPVVNQAAIGQRVTAANRLNGTIKKIAYYPARISNAELQGLTTV
jgi:hypothetical protein